MIRIDNLQVSLGKQKVLSDINMTLSGGLHYGFLGANGAGKSTLMKVLSGDIPYQNGEIWWNERPLSSWPTKELAKVRAILPQKTAIGLPFTGKEILEMGRYPHFDYFPTENDHRILRFIHDLLDVGPFLHRPFSTLSGGEQQRLLLGKALAQLLEEPSLSHLAGKVLILDEPNNNLDLYHQIQWLSLLEYCQTQGLTILTVFHDLNLASRYCQHLILMMSGRLFATGKPKNVLTSAHLHQLFRINAEVDHSGPYPYVLVPTLHSISSWTHAYPH